MKKNHKSLGEKIDKVGRKNVSKFEELKISTKANEKQLERIEVNMVEIDLIIDKVFKNIKSKFTNFGEKINKVNEATDQIIQTQTT